MKLPLVIIFAACIIGGSIIIGFVLFAQITKPNYSTDTFREEKTLSQNKAFVAKGDVVDYTEAKDFVGEEVTVRGKVARVAKPKETIFINFNKDWQNDPFTVVIFKDDVNKFPDIYDIEGKMIYVSGKVQEFRGKAEIILKDPSQLKVE